MEFKYRSVDEQASTYMPQSPNLGYFTEQALRVGYLGHEIRQTQTYYRHSIDAHEAMRREIEKEQIREEIIAAEIIRRRILEAEVRREMMMEREFALRREGFSLSSSLMRFEQRIPSLQSRDNGRSLDDRIAMSFEERSRKEMGSIGMFPFQDRSTEAKIAEVKPPSENTKEKKKIILLAKPDATLSGAKRKAEIPPAFSASELQNLSHAKKKVKEEWSCALCQVSATSEQGLNEHLQGRKHKSKESRLRSLRTGNFGIGLSPKKTDQHTKLVDGTDKLRAEQGVKPALELLQGNNTGQGTLQIIQKTESPKMNDLQASQVHQKLDVKKKELDERLRTENSRERKKKMFKHWCEMCQVGTHTKRAMNAHTRGKKHKSRAKAVNQTDTVVSTMQIVEVICEVSDADKVAKDGEVEAFENAVEAFDERQKTGQ